MAMGGESSENNTEKYKHYINILLLLFIVIINVAYISSPICTNRLIFGK